MVKAVHFLEQISVMWDKNPSIFLSQMEATFRITLLAKENNEGSVLRASIFDGKRTLLFVLQL